MDTNKKPRQLTQEEYERIKKLPERSFLVGGVQRKGHYDEDAGRFYEVGPNGSLTGRVATVNLTPPQNPSTPPDIKPEETTSEQPTPTAPEAEDGDAVEDSTKPSFFARFKWPIIIGGAALLIVIFIAGALSGGSPSQPSDPSSNPVDVLPDKIEVIQVSKSLLMGHTLTPEDVRQATISKEEYQEAALYGRNLYAYEDLDKLVGNSLTKYIPANQFLELSDVQAATPYCINPWTLDQNGTVLIRVPIPTEVAEATSFGFGSTINLTVRRESSSSVAVGDTPIEPNAVPGLTHTTTVDTSSRVDEFTISNLVVCDLFNADGESIFYRYSSYINIPLGERLGYLSNAMREYPDFIAKATPVNALIRVSAEQAEVIGDVFAEGTTATISPTGNTHVTNNEEIQFSSEAEAVKVTLYQAKSENEQKDEEEKAERDRLAQEALAKQQEEAEQNANNEVS